MEFETFTGLEKLLYSLAKEPGFKPKKDEKTPKGVVPSPLISPARYKEGTTRASKNVDLWDGWCCLDVDDYVSSFEEALDLFEQYYFVCYSTASSSTSHPKFRIVFPLTKAVQSEHISHFWFALNKEFKSTVDTQTKDLARMFYVPAQYPGANNFIFTHSGKIMDPDEIMEKHVYVKPTTSPFDDLPEEVQKQILEYRKTKFTNTAITWTSYKDCPFVSKKMILDYSCLNGGWYAKTYKMMCAIACSALKKGYPISGSEIASIFREIDADTGNWYQNRPVELEAERALNYAMKVTPA
jgi:hypothetical protein